MNRKHILDAFAAYTKKYDATDGKIKLKIDHTYRVAGFCERIGKSIGHCYGESISAGQALGQKNTMVGLWLTITFLNPTAAVAPCAYVIWQNMVNSWQLWYKEKYGKLKW